MFSLIITIISIALVAALAVATIYYGGDAFNQGTTKAKASTIVNHAQQIAGANTLYKSTTGGFAGSVTTLVSAYLATAPVNADLASTYAVDAGLTNKVTATLNTGLGEVCKKINEVSGLTSAAAATVAAAADEAAATTAGAGQFFCYGNQNVVFKG